ncbi:UNVERIFIED_CONTAM: hypothetical protein Sradi_1128100 [Sesamum radiatum]|uniref:Uncharacterized protein n=1 Tax=Sesamum radiatum TaxID=300843 RepID=A0AAW2VA37_SESRA
MALLPCENRPMMLKDFLRDDSHTSLNGYPRNSRMLLISSQPNKPSGVLIRSRSKKAAATTISAIHKVINVVKLFQFGSVRSPLVLPRSISRKFPKSRIGTSKSPICRKSKSKSRTSYDGNRSGTWWRTTLWRRMFPPPLIGAPPAPPLHAARGPVGVTVILLRKNYRRGAVKLNSFWVKSAFLASQLIGKPR